MEFYQSTRKLWLGFLGHQIGTSPTGVAKSHTDPVPRRCTAAWIFATHTLFTFTAITARQGTLLAAIGYRDTPPRRVYTTSVGWAYSTGPPTSIISTLLSLTVWSTASFILFTVSVNTFIPSFALSTGTTTTVRPAFLSFTSGETSAVSSYTHLIRFT